MQSIFRLPWCSDPIASKVSEKAALDKMRPSPVVEIPVLNKLKRKRTNSSDVAPSFLGSESKRQRSEDAIPSLTPSANTRVPVKSEAEQTFTHSHATERPDIPLGGDAGVHEAVNSSALQSNISNPNSMDNNAPGQIQTKPTPPSDDVLMRNPPKPASEDAMGFSPLQQVIENEFNMQILMKHDELRLIEQELAKCQIALEQLRRCELRPYPGSHGLSEQVTAGKGPSVAPPPGFTRPSHPPPHGVTDGPYSRHYRQWLLQDSQFDAVPVHSPFNSEAYGRSTRNSGSARQSTSKKFVFPGRNDSLQSIPNYPAPAPRDKSSPLVLRRSTDNQLVKLICNNCNRGNFSSIQGFLNHCRIAHKVDYKSHDAAAIDCGRLLDQSEVASLPTETQNTPAPKPSISRAPMATTTATSTATSTPTRNFVHPFNTTTGASMAVNSKNASPAARKPVRKLNPASSTTESPLTPSAQVPRLSAYFAKHHQGGDLEKATLNARQKVDLTTIDDDLPSPDATDFHSPLDQASSKKTPGSGRGGMTIPGTRPPSNKGFRPSLQRPRPSPLGPPNSLQGLSSDVPESPHSHTLNLSPHTADSNPGLVSDHEDEDDQGSASEEEGAPATEMRRPIDVGVGGGCGAENVEIDVVGDDGLDDGVVIRRHSGFVEEGSAGRGLGVGKRGGC